MTAQILEFKRPVDRSLRRAENANLVGVVVIGFDRKGDFWTDAAGLDNGQTSWLLWLAMWRLMAGVDHAQ